MLLTEDSRPSSQTGRIQRTAVHGKRRQVVVFQVGGQLYGIPVEALDQITFMAELTRPAEAPSLLAGFLNLEGELVAVIRLAHLLGLPETPAELYTPLLIIGCEQERFGLQVSGVTRVAAITESSVLSLDDGDSLNGCVTGIIQDSQEFIGLLAPQRLLLEKERQWIRGSAQIEAQRLGELEALPS
jgi:purine-binding chemotaxis protein CheW